MRDERRSYVLVGAFVLAMLGGLLVWIALLTGHTGATDGYHVFYDRVMNLGPGTQVHYEGYPIGRVEAIAPAGEGAPARFRVELSVKRGWAIPSDSVAVVTASGVLSAVVIDIHAGSSQTLLAPGDAIEGEGPAGVFALVSSTARRISELATELQPLLAKVGEEGPGILDDIRGFTQRLEGTAERLEEALGPETIASARSTLDNFEQSSEQIRKLSAGVGQTLHDVDSLLVDVRGLLGEDQGGVVGHALVDLHVSLESVASHIESISRNLETTSRNLAEFSRQLRENPNVLVTGREHEDGDAP